ncbi:hypothetical protein SEA_OLICIOUS_82 [Streptomyces phage Olicious]|uniref:Uncharacterized protein n=6 Tax=Immanueltrevirus immanuel3 TaxID=2846399 RepID=A0A2H5BMN7_9CAUD|nr:hypothetical protein HWB41_gp18 [Streptomyces phage Immanuel3]AUG87386.1 hypothetical protein SEA_HAUGEANATOR_82 [Streptomyces phage HaugeAnator]AUG87514.1 hypothetical protein SEA_ROMERO_82 [Streptomyces phage Romero]AUG87577.1 hypothetical protein SEA_TORITOKI_82 [Streptomyces phage ToriToki]AUG87643.1 hypothetical protein SEA_ZOOBEAR_82 [Streptomyces phage ZooBear]AZF95869.1 hypothetical protein SEA_OLICIOUS_82 [Streptomyces phage Olicious]
MTTKPVSSSFISTGDVLVYESFSGVLYGVKLLKEVYVEASGSYHWIYQAGQVKNNAWTPNSNGKDIHLATEGDVKASYSLKWTKDELSPVKGDLLSGKDVAGNTVVLVFESKDVVHRVTPITTSTLEVSFGSLGYYQNRLKGLKIMKTASIERPFSKL